MYYPSVFLVDIYLLFLFLFLRLFRNGGSFGLAESGDIDRANGGCPVHWRIAVENGEVNVIGSYVDIGVVAGGHYLISASIDIHAFEGGFALGVFLVINIISIDVKTIHPVFGQHFDRVFYGEITAQAIVVINVHVVVISSVIDGVPYVGPCPLDGNGMIVSIHSIQIMVVPGAAEIHDAVYDTGGIDQIIRHQYVFGFVDFDFIKFRAVLVVIAEVLIKKIIAAKLNGDGVSPFQAMRVLSVVFASENAVIALYITFPLFGAVHIIIQIVGVGIDGGDFGSTQFFHVRSIGVHGIEAAVVIKIGKIDDVLRFAEKSSVIQISRRVAGDIAFVHFDPLGQKYEKHYRSKDEHGNYGDNNCSGFLFDFHCFNLLSALLLSNKL